MLLLLVVVVVVVLLLLLLLLLLCEFWIDNLYVLSSLLSIAKQYVTKNIALIDCCKIHGTIRAGFTMTMEDRSGPGIDRADGATSTVHSCPITQARTATIDGIASDASYPIRRNGVSANKRSFDVAFLVAPDEKLVRRQNSLIEQTLENRPSSGYVTVTSSLAGLRQLSRTIQPTISDRSSPSSLSASPPTAVYPQLSHHHQSHHSPQSNRLNEHHHIQQLHHHDDSSVGPLPKSAFTKVSPLGSFDESQGASPRSSISPDRPCYRSSVSPPGGPTVPIKTTTFKYGAFAAAAAAAAAAAVSTPFPFLVNSSGIPSNESGVQPSVAAENLKIGRKIGGNIESNGFRTASDLSSATASVYSNLPYPPMSVFPAPMTEALVRPRHFLGVAGVTGVASLLPPTFALSLPAQNVCAKCNLSFRMTSDLVYHMRSHHKNEHIGEAARRRREDKLRCPVCDESFRERHHLTRHMTAHQDKASDAIVEQQQKQQHQQQQQQLQQVQLPSVKRNIGGSTVVHGSAK